MFQALTVGFTLILFMMGRSKYEYYFSGIWPVIFVTPILICCRTMSAEAQLAKSRGLPRIICILVSNFYNEFQQSVFQSVGCMITSLAALIFQSCLVKKVNNDLGKGVFLSLYSFISKRYAAYLKLSNTSDGLTS